jgi:hypothetical protein
MWKSIQWYPPFTAHLQLTALVAVAITTRSKFLALNGEQGHLTSSNQELQ